MNSLYADPNVGVWKACGMQVSPRLKVIKWDKIHRSRYPAIIVLPRPFSDRILGFAPFFDVHQGRVRKISGSLSYEPPPYASDIYSYYQTNVSNSCIWETHTFYSIFSYIDCWTLFFESSRWSQAFLLGTSSNGQPLRFIPIYWIFRGILGSKLWGNQ